MARRSVTSLPARTVLALLCAIAAAATAVAQSVTVQAAVERNDVYLGESFRFQIVVSGSDQVTAPDLTAVAGFTVRPVTAGPNNSESVTIINGNTTRQVRKGYVLTYLLTPTSPGELTIPSLTIAVDSRAQTTGAISIQVREPEAVEGYRLRLTLEREQVWVGEPVVLTTSWTWDPELRPERMHSFSHPLFEAATSAAQLTYHHRTPAAHSNDLVRLPVAGQEVLWQRGATRAEGSRFDLLSFTTMLIPQGPGPLHIAPATVVFDGVAGFRNTRDVFGRTVRQKVLQRFVVASNELTLTVKPLPESGRPGSFSGLVGRFEIGVAAAPLEVKVGDPVELTVTITGNGDLRRLPAPDLTRMDGFQDFRVSADAPPVATLERATVRRTLRALHHEVAAIPPVRIVVFDAESGRYTELASQPIPITVHPTRQVTLLDVEGATESGTPRGPVASSGEGIAHNYTGPRLLVDQRFDARAFATSPGGLLALFMAPLLLAAGHLAAALRRFRRGTRRSGAALAQLRHAAATAVADSGAARASGDQGEPRANPSELAAAGAASALLTALRTYLTERLQPAHAIHGFGDVAGPLRNRGVPEAVRDELRVLFASLEAARYGGAGGAPESLAADLVAWATGMEESLR